MNRIVEGLRKSRMAKWPLEVWFLLIASVLGVAFILLLPPGQSPDDISHFRRAYGITEGALIPGVVNDIGGVGSNVPVDVVDVLESFPRSGYYGEILNDLGRGVAEESVQSYNNAALYNFICYLPQSLAILIGKMFGASTMLLAYLARIFNFILWIILTYFAIRIIPCFKKIILFIALLPITLQEATSLSPDALTIGLGFFIVSYVLYLSYVKRSVMSRWEVGLLYLVAAVIGFCKIVYLPLVLLYLVIPETRFGSKKKKLLHLTIIGVVAAVLNVIWLIISSGFLMEFKPGIDSKGQLMWIFSHPLGYLVTIVRTIVMNMEIWTSSMLGMHLGAFVFNLPTIVFLSSFAIFILLFAQKDEHLRMSVYNKIVFAVTFLIITLLIFTSLYMQWTPVGEAVIDGVQGRYFLPILLLLPTILNSGKNKKPNSTLVSSRFVLCYSLVVNIIALTVIFMQNK